MTLSKIFAEAWQQAVGQMIQRHDLCV